MVDMAKGLFQPLALVSCINEFNNGTHISILRALQSELLCAPF